jgi:hypothetical protein
MTRALVTLALICSALFPARAQSPESQRCAANAEFSPVLVSNPKAEVTFACRDATSLELIQSTGRQTRIAIGIVLGADDTVLSRTKRRYRLFNTDAESALNVAVAGTGYTVAKSDYEFLLTAGDLTSRQMQVLTRKFAGFQGGSNMTMVALGSELTMMVQSDLHHLTGFVGSIAGSTNDEEFSLGALGPSNIQGIADRIVSLGSKGIWTLRIDAFQRTNGWNDWVRTEPYQHFSNLPSADE